MDHQSEDPTRWRGPLSVTAVKAAAEKIRRNGIGCTADRNIPRNPWPVQPATLWRLDPLGVVGAYEVLRFASRLPRPR